MSGFTASERYLHHLSERAFLKLWSYPNLYYNKKIRGRGDGKELSDLVVVFGDSVIVFSDKYIKYCKQKGDEVAWPRWFNNAVIASSKQIIGAIKRIKRSPNEIYVDKECTKRLPITLPPTDSLKFYAVCVASGTTEACREFHGDHSGTFMVTSGLRGPSSHKAPFVVGDLYPDEIFHHIFDPEALEIVFREYDTVADFICYLDARESIIRSGRLISSRGEEDLLAVYIMNTDPEGRHGFDWVNGEKLGPDSHITIIESVYQELIGRKEYCYKKNADRVSYIGDDLIDRFSEHIPTGLHEDAEFALRLMASENRISRRLLAGKFRDQLDEAKKAETAQDRYVRRMLPSYRLDGLQVGYLTMLLEYPFHIEGITYEKYRAARRAQLEIYLFDMLERCRNLDYAVGIALDGPRSSKEQGGSEDLGVAGQRRWSSNEIEAIEIDRDRISLRPWDIRKGQRVSATEFGGEKPKMSRQQRRQLERIAKKKGPQIIIH